MIKDSEFITKSNVPGPTREEIRCLVLCKSQVNPQDTVVDIGSGTGGLTIEFAKKANKVYSIDKNSQATDLTLKNLEKHGLTSKVELITGDARSELKRLPDYNILMIGGSGGDLSSILKEGYKKLKGNGKIIITAILIETVTEAIKMLKKLGMNIEVVNVSVSRGKIIERGTMMLAENPITIVLASKKN